MCSIQINVHSSNKKGGVGVSADVGVGAGVGVALVVGAGPGVALVVSTASAVLKYRHACRWCCKKLNVNGKSTVHF